MPRASTLALLLACLLGVNANVRADHFALDLTVKADKVSKNVVADTAALGVKPKERDLLPVKKGSPIHVQWTLANKDSKATFKDVLVHFFVVKIDRANQVSVPKLDQGVRAESALTMDFDPGDRTEGKLAFVIDRPGIYLLRLETVGAAVGIDGHEHFAALDLIVE